MTFRFLRFLPLFAVIACVHFALYRTFCALFAPRPEQALRRRLLLAAHLLGALSIPAVFLASRSGAQLRGPLRWLAEPVLGAEIFAVPLALLLGIGLSVAQRWRRAPLAGPAAARPDVAAAAPRTPGLGSDDEREPRTGPGVEAGRAAGAPAAAAGLALPESRRVVLRRAAAGLLGATAAAVAFGVEEAEALPLVERRDIHLPGLHADLDGVTILQLSDVHSGLFMTEERMARIAAAAAALQPDLVVFTGDLLDASATAAGPFTRGFRDLHGRLGTFAVLGNHDYFAGERAALRAVHDAGGVMLRNAGARVQRGSGSIWIGGVDDPLGRERGGSGGSDAQAALRGAAPDEARIVLAHRPQLFPACAAAGAQLTLSGHTHGGQIALSPRLSLARVLGPYTMGHFQRGPAQLYVHRGLGVVAGAPVRLGSRPEIALLTLRRS